MPGTSYLTATDAEGIRQAKRDALATSIALRGAVSVVLSRYDESAGAAVSLSPQMVLVTFANRESSETSNLGATATYRDGTFRKEVPFDVAVGDVFRLSNGQRGSVTGVALPDANIQAATFSLDVGTR